MLKTDETTKGRGYRIAFVWVTILFFMWGFMTVLNDILIPHFKEIFDLNYTQAMLVQFSFFGAYFVGSLIYFLISTIYEDPILKIGYKNGLLLGLLVSAIGAALFYPAAEFSSYVLFLGALFVIGLGFTLLQISANPYVSILGPEKSASSRLNLAQGFNALGTTLGPVIGGYAIYEYFKMSHLSGAESLKTPYLIFAGVFLVMTILFSTLRLPSLTTHDLAHQRARAFAFPQLRFGMLAIFFYVGAEVSIGSIIISYLGDTQIASLPEIEASKFVSLYWGGQMIGRFIGSVSLSDMKNKVLKYLLMLVFPAIGFAVVAYSYGVEKSLPYLLLLVVNYIAFLFGKSIANRTLFIFAIFNIGLIILAWVFRGTVAMWSVIGIGLFNSIMWSNIFTLAIAKLGKHTSQGSSLLVMMIVGGAILPLITGFLSDVTSIVDAVLVPLVAYCYIAFFGLKGYRTKEEAEIDIYMGTEHQESENN